MKQQYNENFGVKNPGPVWNIKVYVAGSQPDKRPREQEETKHLKIKVLCVKNLIVVEIYRIFSS